MQTACSRQRFPDMTLPPLQPLSATTQDNGEAPPTRAAVSILDAQALAALAQLDPNGSTQLVRRVMTTYRASLARLVAQLALARKNADLAALRLATHTLKSSSASVGALSLSALCGAAESAVREGRLEGLPPLLDQLEAEAVRVDAAVLQLLTDPP